MIKIPQPEDFPEVSTPYNHIRAYIACSIALTESVVLMRTAIDNMLSNCPENAAVKEIMQDFVKKFEQP